MAKGKKDGKEKSAVSTGNDNLTYKREARRKQSETDHQAAVSREGWIPKKTVEEKDRCGACRNPSAAVRHGAKLCVRCDGKPNRDRQRQKNRTVHQSDSQPQATPRSGRPLSPLASALSSVPAN